MATFPRPTLPVAIRWLSWAIPCVFLLLGAIRAYPFVDDVSPATAAGDDWLSYKLNALSILHGGLRMPSVPGPYTRPGGFLYNYFVAAVFALFGENVAVVYIAQSGLLGLSAVLVYRAFGRFLSPGAGASCLVTLALYLYVDVFRLFTRRLLSEDLVIPLLALFFLLLVQAYERRRLSILFAAGLVLGLALLTRPNLIVFSAFSTVLVWVFFGRHRPAPLRVAGLYLLAWTGVACLIVARNYAATGEPSVAVLSYTGDFVTPSTERKADGLITTAWRFAGHYARRVLFCAGFTPALDAHMRPRPHWMLMWASCLAYGWRRYGTGPPVFWEALLISFVICYLGPLIAVAQISNYGVRMIVPVLLGTVPLAAAGMSLSGRSRALAGAP